MKPLKIFLLVLALLMMTVPSLIIVYNIEEVETTIFCVDGQGNANLEGKMCLKTGQSILGLDEENSQIFLIIAFLLMLLGVLLSLTTILTIMLNTEDEGIK